MKRSRSIALVLLGSTSLLMVACDQSDPLASNDFFRDERECARVNNPDACRQALVDARAVHQRTAPAFASREACEAQFGAENCTETKQAPAPEQLQAAGQERQPVAQSGGSWFLPAMLGYMMGRNTAGPSMMPGQVGLAQRDDQQKDQQTGTGRSSRSSGSGGGARYSSGRPLYRDVNNTVYSGSQSLGQTHTMAPPKATSTSVSRSGFGRTGTSASS